MGHILMENRHGLIVDVEITHASGTAEREAALAMLARRDKSDRRITLGADKGYDSKAFFEGLRRLKVTPHVAAKDRLGSTCKCNTLTSVGWLHGRLETALPTPVG
jgi:hypothetical protein